MLPWSFENLRAVCLLLTGHGSGVQERDEISSLHMDQ